MPWWYDVVEARHDLQNPTSPEKIRLLGERLGLGPSSRVLDVGSGKGGPAVLLAKEFACRLTCVERAPEFASVARERATEQIEVIEADASAVELEAETYDAALCLGASFVYGGPVETLEALLPAVRPRGFVAVGEPYWRTWPLPESFEPDEGETEWKPLAETVALAESAGVRVVSLIDASLDDWDRHETLRWIALDEWLAANPDDPEAEEFRARPAQPRAVPALAARSPRVGDLRMPEMTFEELVERARADERVAGLFLGGSRGKGANVRPDSDYDVRVVLFEEDEEAFRAFDTPRGVQLEVAVTTLDGLRAIQEWDRYTLTHTKAIVDKTGEIQRLIDDKGRLSADEAERVAPLALDGYMNSLYRSLKRPGLAARIHAGESVGHLLACLFALEGRVRPFHDYLAWELENHPLEGWPAEELLGQIEHVVGGERGPQQELFRRVDPHVRARGLGDVVDLWEPDVPFMRGEP